MDNDLVIHQAAARTARTSPIKMTIVRIFGKRAEIVDSYGTTVMVSIYNGKTYFIKARYN